MLDKNERIRQRIKLTKEERIQEVAEEALKRGFGAFSTLLRMTRMEPEVIQTVISEKLVDFCAKHNMVVEDLIAKVHTLEKIRTDKIKEDEDKIKLQGGQHEIR